MKGEGQTERTERTSANYQPQPIQQQQGTSTTEKQTRAFSSAQAEDNTYPFPAFLNIQRPEMQSRPRTAPVASISHRCHYTGTAVFARVDTMRDTEERPELNHEKEW